MNPRNDLGRWHHGASNSLECMGTRTGEYADGHGILATNLDDRSALRQWQNIEPPEEGTER